MRKPTVKNKHDLKFSDISHFVVLRPEALHNLPFWRNENVNAWCLVGSTAQNYADEEYGTYSEYWLGFYDSGEIGASCSSDGGMYSCFFERFFDPEDIENEIDLRLEEILLKELNWLLDSGIVRKGNIHDEPQQNRL